MSPRITCDTLLQDGPPPLFRVRVFMYPKWRGPMYPAELGTVNGVAFRTHAGAQRWGDDLLTRWTLPNRITVELVPNSERDTYTDSSIYSDDKPLPPRSVSL